MFLDDFEDNDISDWVGTPLVYNDLAIELGQIYEPPLSDVHDGWVWGKGSGFTNPRYTWIVRPAAISATGELAVELVGHAGPGISSGSVHLLATGWPRDGHVYEGAGYFHGEIVDAWAEGYEIILNVGSSERSVYLRLHHFVGETRGTEVLFQWDFEGILNDHTYRVERSSEGLWTLYYGDSDGSDMVGAPIGEIRDLTFTSFENVALAMFREESGIGSVKVEVPSEPPVCCPGCGSPDMVCIPGGTFQMGDSLAEGDPDELPVHTVTLSSFCMGRYEITNRQYCDYLSSALSGGLITSGGGGVYGRRFPWGDTISHAQANYYSSTDYTYDVSPTRSYHPTYELVRVIDLTSGYSVLFLL